MDTPRKPAAEPNVAGAIMLIASMSAACGEKRPLEPDPEGKTPETHAGPDLQPETHSAAARASRTASGRNANRGPVKKNKGKGQNSKDKTPHDSSDSADPACQYIVSEAKRLSSDEHIPQLSKEMLTCEREADITSPYGLPDGYFSLSLARHAFFFFSFGAITLRARELSPPPPTHPPPAPPSPAYYD